MARVAVIDPQPTGETKALLDAVQSGLGMVPNFYPILATLRRRFRPFSACTASPGRERWIPRPARGSR